MNILKYKLRNNIRIVHQESSSRVSHLALMINTGSRDENKGQEGIAHFIEHTIFKGTKKRKAFQVLGRMDNVGGDVNAYTTKEETCIYSSFLNDNLNRAVEWFADISQNSIFPEKEINKEKEIIIDEINSYKDNPQEEIFDEIEEYVFPNHQLGKSILGSPEQVKKINRNKILRFIKQNYNTDEMVIVSIGNYKFEKLVKFIEKHFANLENGKSRPKRTKPDIYIPGKLIKPKAFHQAHCMIANKTVGLESGQRFVISLLNNLLGGPGLNTRLNLGIREKHGFCYNIESNYSPYSDCGIFNIYMGTDFSSIDKTIELVLAELKKLRTRKLGSLQLERAKKQFIGQNAIADDEAINRLMAFGRSILSYDYIMPDSEFENIINNIDANSILEAANQIFEPKNLFYLIYNKR